MPKARTSPERHMKYDLSASAFRPPCFYLISPSIPVKILKIDRRTEVTIVHHEGYASLENS